MLQVRMVVMLAGRQGGVIDGKGHDRGFWGAGNCSELDLGGYLGDLVSNIH